MKNKTNTIPVKGTVVEAILEEFRGFYDPDGFSEKKLEAFLSSALLRVQEQTLQDIENHIKIRLTAPTKPYIVAEEDRSILNYIQAKLKEKNE